MKSFRFPFPLTLTLPLALLLAACGGKEDNLGLPGLFNPVDTVHATDSLIIPGGGYSYRILFQQNDPIRADWADTVTYAKGAHDFLAYLPINGAADHGILWVNHEAASPHDVLGDGGGGTVIEVFRDSLKGWTVVGLPHAVDFRPVGGTLLNCLGAVTPWGTILTSEEVEPMGPNDIRKTPGKYYIRDSADIEGWARWKNYGWMVEVDPYTRKALRKQYAMGRFMHEGAYCMPDNRTVYLLDDVGPGAFFKFVADRPKDLSAGILYAYKQTPDGKAGEWLALPRERDSLLVARQIAFKRGATIFIRMEDIELHSDGTFILSETGLDSVDFTQALAWGGKPAKHQEKYHVGNSIYDDKYGRLLRYNPKTEALTVILEGGQGKDDETIHFSNPDNMAMDTKRNYLVIHEDIVGKDYGRSPLGDSGDLVNEVYFLDVSKPGPYTIDQLQRFAVTPNGAEGTGAVWNTDFSALFFNIQHPTETNKEPFNRSTTVVVSGFPEK